MVCTFEYINNWLKANLNAERYEHSLGTADCARELAKKFGLNEEKAYFTGLIHDCAKCLPKDETMAILKDLSLEDGELCNPKTHHAPVGVVIAKKEFGVDDEEVLSAIRWHTLGKVDMTDFEKIIFLADKIETRTRPCELCEPIRTALEDGGLDAALLICYENTIKSLVDRRLTICLITIEIYNALLVKCKKCS